MKSPLGRHFSACKGTPPKQRERMWDSAYFEIIPRKEHWIVSRRQQNNELSPEKISQLNIQTKKTPILRLVATEKSLDLGAQATSFEDVISNRLEENSYSPFSRSIKQQQNRQKRKIPTGCNTSPMKEYLQRSFKSVASFAEKNKLLEIVRNKNNGMRRDIYIKSKKGGFKEALKEQKRSNSVSSVSMDKNANNNNGKEGGGENTLFDEYTKEYCEDVIKRTFIESTDQNPGDGHFDYFEELRKKRNGILYLLF
jgi:hypothetical protein